MVLQQQDKLLTGLTSQEARERLGKFGLNILPEKPPPSSFLIFLDQFKSPLVYVLLAAALVTAILGHFPDTAIILWAVFLNTVFGFYQEQKAKKALYALSKILTPRAKVIRDGEKKIIDARELVPGDLVVLEFGDKIPADGVFVKIVDLAVNEAVLTGESQPVFKKVKDHGFMGTIVASGRAELLVTKTGVSTEMGKIAEIIGEKEEKTPLERRLAALARTLAGFVGIAALLVFVSGIIVGKSIVEMFTTAVALAVAAIPEGLVISLTVILAIGMQRILKRKALVRKLACAETLGSVTVICADKTGTLTEGKMRVVKSEFIPGVKLGIEAAAVCNNLSDPLEYAMWEWVRSKGEDPQKIVEDNPRINEVPFSVKHRFIATLHEKEIFVSGAPEILLSSSKIEEKERKIWEKKFESFAKEGLRLVGFAVVKNGELEKEFRQLKLTKALGDLSNLSFLGILGFEDPVRPEVADTLRECQKAGIAVKVITGDFLATGVSVLAKLGIKVSKDEVIEGEELAKIGKDELGKRIGKLILFARTDPFQKLKIIETLKEKGEIVAMTGDGVNDAPALAKADIGIVVSQASEVARETADMVLLDSNFATIVAAIEEGRGIFENLKKVILYLLSDAFSELLVIFGALIMNFPLPLTAGQILWINLVADGFPDLALTVDPKRKGLMGEPPVNPKENLLNPQVKALIALVSLFAGASTLLIFFLFFKQTGDLILSRSLAFALLGTNSLFYVFSCRSLRKPVWQTDIFANPWLILAVGAGFLLLASAFYLPPLVFLLGITPLGFFEWGIVVAIGFATVLIIEITKFLFMLKSKRK
ncbi:MAG: Ca2+-transporting ATPase [Microgenomates group bacterium LiPW_16]|nr:MAG: Ca2+-transporting ATPase [Microgenomates group bacterium LiPW_16]